MMKRLYGKLIFALLCLAVFPAFGQSYLEDPKWGATEEERSENALIFNLFRDAYNNKDYVEAVPYLQQLMEKAPKSSANIYVYGINIYKNKANRATSVQEKNSYVDSLVILYDKRVEHFGDDPTRGASYILPLKAVDYLAYRPADRDNIRRYFREAVEAGGEKAEPDIVVTYFNELTEDYKADNIEADEYLTEYDKLEAVLKSPSNVANTDAFKSLESLFISSGAANCDNLEKMFGGRIDSNPNDYETIEKALTLLSRGNCKGDFFMKLAEMHYQHDPSSQTALVLASGYEDKKDYESALKYLNAALASETDPELKHNLAVRIASSQLGLGNARSAATYAREAIQINPDSGLAYYLLGQAYASGASQCSDFNRATVYWLVYDTLQKARSLMSGDEVGNIDSQLGSYRASFPSREDCFFHGLNDGDGYTVNCGWVSGRTTVRGR